MAEAKRAELTTVGTLKKERKPKDDAPTYRFQLTLGESNEKTCPEYSYSQLVKTVRGREPTKNGSSTLPEDGRGPAANDPFAQEDDEDNEKLKAMAQKFEEKYAPKPEKKPWRNKVGRMEDYIDLGMGYDETDPFIDNTDAYDELVPSTLTTKYGGFYINSGKLDFKELQSESSEDEIEDPTKKRKRRRLKEFDKDNMRRKKKFIKDGREGDFIPKKRGRKPMDRVDGKKQPTVADLLQQHKARRQSPQPSSPAQQPQQPSFPQPNIQATIAAELALVAAGLVGAGELMQRPEGSIKDIIESVVGAVREKESNGMDYAPNTSLSSSSDSSDDPTFMPQTGAGPKLPEGLTDDMDDAINQIKIAARKSADGKCKFFSHEVNNILLNIEMMSRDLSCSQRSTVYGHLASHLPCTKETLLKRVKKLRLDQEDGKLREPMRRLKEAIDEIMPELEETYRARCLVATEGGVKIAQGSSSGEDEEKGKNLDYFFDVESDRSSRDEEENVVEGVKLIRRKFQWNDKIRKLLCDVVQIKMKCFEVSKMRTQSAEEYLKYFLETEVQHLWPKGWMGIRKLIKETRLVHAHLTYRPKRNLLAVKKLLPAVSLLPIGNATLKNALIDASMASIMESTTQGAAHLKPIQFSVTCTPSTFTSASTPASHDVNVVSSSSTSGSVLPRVSITSTTRTATSVPASVREPDPPSIIVTTISSVGGKSAAATTSNVGTSVIQTTTPPSFQATKAPPMQALESPGKLSRAHKSLFDVSVVSAIASGDVLPKVNAAGGISSAKDILSEIINKSLAGFSNSEKLSGAYKYRDSPKFAAFLSKPFSGGSGNHAKSQPETKACFTVPKKMAAAQPVVKMESHKDPERHVAQERRSSGGTSHVPQDLRTQSRSLANSGGASASSQKLLHADMYLPVDCLPGKIVPFHSMYDMQGAISRELQGQNVPSSLSVLSPGGFKAKSRPLTSSPKSSYYATAGCDQPLNFSTARQAVSALPERSRNITPPQANLNSPQERSRGSSPISPSSAVRMVNLPHHQTSNKYISGSSPLNDPRSRTPHEQVYLEGIAASFQEYHLKKPQHRNIDASLPPTNVKSGAGHPDLNNLSPPGHVLVNHNLPKVSSTYSEPIHSISQGCTEIPFHHYPRYALPPTLQGNSSTP